MTQEISLTSSEDSMASPETIQLPAEASLTLNGLAEAEVKLGNLTKDAAVKAGVDFARGMTLSKGQTRFDRGKIGAFYDKIN